jgi:hypothetical protein
MASLLAPNGLLMLDPTEHPGKAGHLFASGSAGVYSRGGFLPPAGRNAGIGQATPTRIEK